MRSPWLVLAGLLLVASCGLPGNVVVLIPDENGGVGKVLVKTPATTTLLDQPDSAVGKRFWQSQPGAAFEASQGNIADAFGAALAATPRTPLHYNLYFVLDQATLIGSSRTEVQIIVEKAKTLPNLDVSVVGHADAIGSAAVNEALSLRRAQVVRDLLVRGGISAAIIETAYYGANDPLIPTPLGVPEPRNRRVEVTLR